MNDPDSFFTGRRIAFIGLGLMGGSMALALRRPGVELHAVDPDPATRKLALDRQVADRIYAEVEEIPFPMDAIVLAAPVRAIIAHIHILGDLARRSPQSFNLGLSDRTILLDLGSTKREIVEAMNTLPEAFDPLGGHPMCGKETSGLANAEAALYREAVFAFTPLERTSPQARAFAGKLAAAVGASPFWTDPATHDRWVAITSHLPYLLANALAGVTPCESAPLVGPGYRSTSRLAESSLTMMTDILQTNRRPVLEALHRFRGQLELLEKSLAVGDFTALAGLLDTAAQNHHALVRPPDL
jgi:prephenate dehydrogenase